MLGAIDAGYKDRRQRKEIRVLHSLSMAGFLLGHFLCARQVRKHKWISTMASDPSFIANLWRSKNRKDVRSNKGADDGELLDYVEEEEEVEEEEDDDDL